MVEKEQRLSFTLIEILIVTSIIIILIGSSLVYYNNFTEEKKLELTNKKLVDILELAKKRARASDTSSCSAVSGLPSVSGFSVIITSENSYQMKPECTSGTAQTITYQTDSGVEFTSLPITIYFPPLSRTSDCQTIIIKNNKLNKCRYININAAGSIDNGVCSDCDSCSLSFCLPQDLCPPGWSICQAYCNYEYSCPTGMPTPTMPPGFWYAPGCCPPDIPCAFCMP